MKVPARLYRLTAGLLMAGSILAQGTGGGERKTQSQEPPEGAAQLSIEKPEVAAGESSAGHKEGPVGSVRETKDAARQDKDQRDGLFILLLQILRTPK